MNADQVKRKRSGPRSELVIACRQASGNALVWLVILESRSDIRNPASSRCNALRERHWIPVSAGMTAAVVGQEFPGAMRFEADTGKH